MFESREVTDNPECTYYYKNISSALVGISSCV